MTRSLYETQPENRDLVVVHIGDLPGLRDLAAQWWELWRGVPAATPFQSPAWLIPWYECFRPGPLCCVAVYRQRKLIALAPFYFEDGVHGRRLLPLGISISDNLDVLVAPACESAVGALLLMHLLRPPYDGALCCEELRPDAAALRMWA